MNILIRAAVLLAAGAAGWAFAQRRRQKENENDDPRVVYLKDEEAVIDAEPQPAFAEVVNCYRRMDPINLQASNEAVFRLEDESEVKLNFEGEGGLHLKKGDRGMLTWRGMRLIRFEKDTGEVIGGMFYAPAGEEENE